MTELYLMRGTLGVFCYAPFAVEGEVRDERTAFAHRGKASCRIADTDALLCPQRIEDVGDAIEILLSRCWSSKAAAALDGIRWSSTMRRRDIEVRNSEDGILSVFEWAVDFGRYDVLDRQRSQFSVMKGTNVINDVQFAVVDDKGMPDADI